MNHSTHIKMYNWTFQDNLLIAAKAFVLGPIIYFIEQYVFNDWSFLISIVLLLFVDGFIMTVRGLTERDYKMEKAFREFASKTFATVFTIMCISIVDLALIRGETNMIIEWVNGGFYAVLLTFFMVSILKNLYHIFPLDFISDILDKVDKWKGKPNDNGINVKKNDTDKQL